MDNTLRIKTIDLHAAGEPCRVIYDHFLDTPGATMFDKRNYISTHCDHLRRALVLEPRGHADMFGSILTRPISPEADAGVIFLTNSGYLDMCIHGSICTSRAVAELGIKLKNPNRVVLDTVGGQISARLIRNNDGRIDSVEIENVPSFRYTPQSVKIHIDKLGEIEADVVFAGNFFAVVDGDRYPQLRVDPERYELLSEIGMEIKQRMNEVLQVAHPQRTELTGIALSVIFNRHTGEHKHLKNVVVFGNRQIDRSPCGTGTSGMMVYLHSIGELQLGEPLISESIIGSCFRGQLIAETRVEEFEAYLPAVQGTPSITSYAEFILEEDDIYRYGIPVLL